MVARPANRSSGSSKEPRRSRYAERRNEYRQRCEGDPEAELGLGRHQRKRGHRAEGYRRETAYHPERVAHRQDGRLELPAQSVTPCPDVCPAWRASDALGTRRWRLARTGIRSQTTLGARRPLDLARRTSAGLPFAFPTSCLPFRLNGSVWIAS